MPTNQEPQPQNYLFRYSLATIICNASALILDFIPRHLYSVHYGKDDGMLFQFSMTMIISFLIFSVGEKNWYSKILMGPTTAIASYVLTFALMTLMSLLDFRDTVKDLPGTFFSIVPFTFILLIFFWRSEKQKSQPV